MVHLARGIGRILAAHVCTEQRLVCLQRICNVFIAIFITARTGRAALPVPLRKERGGDAHVLIQRRGRHRCRHVKSVFTRSVYTAVPVHRHINRQTVLCVEKNVCSRGVSQRRYNAGAHLHLRRRCHLADKIIIDIYILIDALKRISTTWHQYSAKREHWHAPVPDPYLGGTTLGKVIDAHEVKVVLNELKTEGTVVLLPKAAAQAD